MDEYQNKELTKWAIHKWLILKRLDYGTIAATKPHVERHEEMRDQLTVHVDSTSVRKRGSKLAHSKVPPLPCFL